MYSKLIAHLQILAQREGEKKQIAFCRAINLRFVDFTLNALLCTFLRVFSLRRQKKKPRNSYRVFTSFLPRALDEA